MAQCDPLVLDMNAMIACFTTSKAALWSGFRLSLAVCHCVYRFVFFHREHQYNYWQVVSFLQGMAITRRP